MDAVMLLARIIFAFMFVMSGLNHFTKAEHMVGYATFKKIPMPKLANSLAGLVLVGGGLSVILGIYADLGAIALAVLLKVMALKMHDFWTQSDPQAKQTEMIAFMKNISMSGGALFIFAMAASNTDIGWTLTDALWNFAK